MPTLSHLYAPLPGFEPTHAAWPVWGNSTPKTVRFEPVPKKEAHRRYQMAREFDRVTKKGAGCHGGAVGRIALKVLEALTFDFLNYSSGQLDPGYKAIARAANVSASAVHTALKRLQDLGILVWQRRCHEGYEDGRYVRRQDTNAYCILPCSAWRGFTPPREAPPPLSGTWGAPARVPDIHEAAIVDRKTGGDPQGQIRILDLAPRGSLEAVLAGLGRMVAASGRK